MKIANTSFYNDLAPVVLWQYTDALKLKAMVRNEQSFMDNAVTQFWTDFNKDVLNLATCNAFGLSLWGRLLRVQRPTYLDGGVAKVFTDEQYRLLLKARVFLLTFDGSTKSLNQFFKTLFPDVVVEVVDNLDMTVNINFLNEITPDIEVVLRMHEIDPITGELVYTFLPRPAGVQYVINTEVDYSKVFGFEGMTHEENGVQVEPPAFTDKDSTNYDPTTDGGGTFIQ